MATVALKSRLPEIALELQARLEVLEKAGAEAIEEGAKARVPVDEGTLRDAIHVRDEAEGSYVVAGDDEAFYGHIIEFGSVKREPRPFLIPALEATRDPLYAAAIRALRGL